MGFWGSKMTSHGSSGRDLRMVTRRTIDGRHGRGPGFGSRQERIGDHERRSRELGQGRQRERGDEAGRHPHEVTQQTVQRPSICSSK